MCREKLEGNEADNIRGKEFCDVQQAVAD